MKYLAAIAAALLGLFAFSRHFQRIGVANTKRKLRSATRTLEKELKKKDSKIDFETAQKIEAIERTAKKILQKKAKTGADANALIDGVK